ncbi:MAG: tRNA (adenosine(37)-N6)-threonylcarbamoyltransferase complex dimerization subunit type 1 TsaB [Candidatus Izemoplasma sp.]|nr:tRNA (adenosine(37)-N6)-threonylcarbamoyltransferase complex dimerization subunit type 1 TsaB [Candidatus Izemoplasma sp.]
MNTSFHRLIIDSATPYLYVALLEGNRSIQTYYKKGDNNHSEVLMPTVETLFKDSGLSINDIDEVIVGIGPGSYTGVRIGVVVAKMIAWNQRITIKTVSSLALMASSESSDGYILAHIDARRKNAFMGLYLKQNGLIEPIGDEVFMSSKAFQEKVPYPFTIVESGEPDPKVLLASNILTPVENVHHLAPNYLRKTEAERNLSNS